MRALGLKTAPSRSWFERMWDRWSTMAYHHSQHRRACRHYVQSMLSRWRRWVMRGGLAAPEIYDNEEAVFGDDDLRPVERRQVTKGLRHFLLQGQDEWRKDGGVVVPEVPQDQAMGGVMRCIERALRRRPTVIIPKWDDARNHLGTFWELQDFQDLPPSLFELLTECRELEARQLECVRETGRHVGDTISAAGCEQLGVPDDLQQEWLEGVWFDVDPSLPHYSKGPYANVYRDLATLIMACTEFNKLLKWLIPVCHVPWIESRTTVVTKDAPLEPGGFKHRTCTDLTASGLNDAVRLLYMWMPRLLEIVSKMGPGSYMAKQDLKDMFYSWRVHPKLWTFFGIRHPVTGQSFVFPVLPMGFKLSPPLACRNTAWMATLAENEMRARWEKRASVRPILASIPRSAEPDATGAPPASTVYVDDYMGSAAGNGWIEELVEVCALIFLTLGVTEKLTKREGPAQILCLLGFLFSTLTHQLKIPEDKAREICYLLDSVLTRVDKQQSVSHQELSSLIGKLTWASAALVLGKAYLRHIRKPVIAVQDLLRRRRDRERFCVPLWHFQSAVDELRWYRHALALGGGTSTIHVGPTGCYEIWRWHGVWGDRVPADVVQWATDASKWGGGFWIDFEYRVREWDQDEMRQHINILECLMILHVIMEMGPSLRGRRCLGWCDNTTTVQAINSGRSKSNRLMQIVRRVHLACIEFDIQLWLVHIPGVHNITADGLSRGVLGARVESWGLTPQCMQRWSKAAGGFDVDAFADAAGAMAKAPRYRSAQCSWDSKDFKGQKVWAFPPVGLIDSFFEESAKWEAELIFALVPSERVPEGKQWEVLEEYPRGSRLFERPCGVHRVRCKPTGLAWSVISRMRA
mmetsp:Transcript_30390/g.62634  ORF Transcript_30390/g.62634 Transcript_30390/m.62634 type:complete len:863 (+) Transcript_30390:1289-3877(+)